MFRVIRICPLKDKCKELNVDGFTCFNPSHCLDFGCEEYENYKKRKRYGNKAKKHKQIIIKK